MEIQLLSKHGLSLRRITAEVGRAVNTVRRHLALEAVPKYERKVTTEVPAPRILLFSWNAPLSKILKATFQKNRL